MPIEGYYLVRALHGTIFSGYWKRDTTNPNQPDAIVLEESLRTQFCGSITHWSLLGEVEANVSLYLTPMPTTSRLPSDDSFTKSELHTWVDDLYSKLIQPTRKLASRILCGETGSNEYTAAEAYSIIEQIHLLEKIIQNRPERPSSFSATLAKESLESSPWDSSSR